MRSVCREMISRNFRARRPFGSAIEQGLDVSLDGGQRRPQFVRDVGDEVAADAIRAPEVGDVVQHEHRAGRALGARNGRGADRHDQALLQRQLDALRLRGRPARR